jgi:DNA polymerase III, subunit gamma and tau
MEEYIVSARKYRPMSFDAVVGQDSLTTTLKNAVKSGKLAHAYLFCGPRGVGKTTCARIFAKAINCETPTEAGEACNACESCKAFNEGRSYNIFELDAASNNSVENIKSLMEQTRIPPQVGRYKVFIIDEVHMLSTAAFNAFLKTLEEPPAHVIFILATTEKHKILPTILSRCQIYDFERMTVPNIVAHLKQVAAKENVAFEEEALAVIADKADGGMRDALSIFDQTASFCQGNITYQKVIEDLNVLDAENYFKVLDYALENQVTDVMVLLNNVLRKGFDGGHFINGLAQHIRNVLMAHDAATLPLLEVSQQQQTKYQQQAQKCPVKFLYRALKLLNQCDVNYKQSSNKRLLVELTLIQMAQITQDDDGAGAGRSPKRLKILFQKIIKHQSTKAASQVAATGVSASVGNYQMPPAKPQEVNEPQPQHVVKITPSQNVSQSNPGTLKMNLGSLGITFSSLDTKPDVVPVEEDVTPEIDARQQGKFTQEALENSWFGMLKRFPESLVGLGARLRNITPHITTYPRIEFVFDNELLLHEAEKQKARIKVTLAKELQNGQIELDWRVAESHEIKKILTKRELFDKLKEQNGALSKLCQTLQLDLA